jgi:aminoglycoside phosphotransferase (APT) family kinase protein
VHDSGLPPRKALEWCGNVTRVTALPGATTSAVHAIELADGTQLVLRRYLSDEWQGDEAGAVMREATALRRATTLPAPRLVKADPEGTEAGAPALLMTRIPGNHDWRPDLAQLAALLRRIHAIEPTQDLPAYEAYGLHTSMPPPWTGNPDIWHEAFRLFHGPPPPHATTLIHRDFHPGNVIWRDGRVTGIVDWVMAGRGAPQADVGHCRWNLARTQSPQVADEFLDATGYDYHPYWDVVAALGGQNAGSLAPEDEAFLVHALA